MIAMRVLAAVVMVLAVRDVASAQRDPAREVIIEAIQKRDVATLVAHTNKPLPVIDVWFDTEECREFSGARVMVADKDLPALFECLADLELRVADPESAHVHYGPGIPLHMVTNGKAKSPELRGLVGFTPRRASETVPTIATSALARHVAGHTNVIVPDAKLRKTIDANEDAFAYAELEVCIDENGRVTRAEVRSTSDGHAAYGALAARAIRRWKVTPFVMRGKRVAVCARQDIGYPMGWGGRLTRFSTRRSDQ